MDETSVPPAYKVIVERITPDHHARGAWYRLWIDDSGIYDKDKETRKKVKGALASLRKAIKAYRHSPEYSYNYTHNDWNHNTVGNHWVLYIDLLWHFADWFEFFAPLDVLIKDADELAERWREADERRAREQQRQWQEEFADRGFGFGFTSRGQRIFPHSKFDEALQVFGLSRPVTLDDIKRRYRVLAKQTHPDTGGDAEQFKHIHNAYQVLESSLA
jgi:hypothetical protein